MSKRIVVVDDMPLIRTVVSIVLGELGYTLFEAEDGEAALTLIRQEKPDLVITDKDMPNMTGLELARALRADPQTAAIPILLISAALALRDIETELNDGTIDAGLAKPFKKADLLALVLCLLGEEALLE